MTQYSISYFDTETLSQILMLMKNFRRKTELEINRNLADSFAYAVRDSTVMKVYAVIKCCVHPTGSF